ncbi:MAG: MFS transporter [Clostridia bacterium]|nr:MFS transporter [Clostridia bacterium]
MPEKQSTQYPYVFVAYYIINFMAFAIFSTFTPVFLNDMHYDQTSIGALLSVGAFVSIAAQPFWGLASDRANYKISILKILILANSISFCALAFYNNFYYALLIMAVFSFFQSPLPPLSDAITLEYLETTKWKFGPIRMMGTIGFAISAYGAGFLINRNIDNIFIIYLIFSALTLTVTFFLPKIRGHQAKKDRVSLLKLFENKEMILLMIFNLVISISTNFYGVFFPIHFEKIGADKSLLGLAIFIATVSEIPFLLFANKVLDKLGTKRVLFASAFMTALRWLLIYFISNPYILLPFQLLHGFTFIVFAYSMATYINEKVPKELKASGQTMYALVSFSTARIIGGLLGGILSDLYGIKIIFLFSSILCFGVLLVFGIIFYRNAQKSAAN